MITRLKYLFAYIFYCPAIKYVQKSEDRLGFKEVRVIQSDNKDYHIMEHMLYNGKKQYCTFVKHRNKIKLWKEYYKDYIGLTYNYPVFLSNFYHESVESAEHYISIHIKLERNE